MAENDYINKDFAKQKVEEAKEFLQQEREKPLREEQKPELTRCEFQFEQDGNSIDGGDEMLIVEVKTNSPSLDKDDLFFVLKTEQWSIDSLDELKKLVNGITELIENI
jgi:hypothetical protein